MASDLLPSAESSVPGPYVQRVGDLALDGNGAGSARPIGLIGAWLRGPESRYARWLQQAALSSPLLYGAVLAKFGAHAAIPSLCVAKLMLGIECPACGMSTALLRLFQGNLVSALHANIAVIPLVVLLVASMLVSRSNELLSGPALRLLTRALLVAFALQFARQFAPHLIA